MALQRDPTAFGVLTPGAQAANNGGRLPIIGGTGSYLGQLYLDGMPAETVSQQGDNRLVSESMDLDAVDQFQLVTSTPPAEYMGAGAENFTMKSGGLQVSRAGIGLCAQYGLRFMVLYGQGCHHQERAGRDESRLPSLWSIRMNCPLPSAALFPSPGRSCSSLPPTTSTTIAKAPAMRSTLFRLL